MEEKDGWPRIKVNNDASLQRRARVDLLKVTPLSGSQELMKVEALPKWPQNFDDIQNGAEDAGKDNEMLDILFHIK